MIIHILKNGKVLEDITALVVPEEACPNAYAVIDSMNHERGVTNEEKKQDQK